MKIYPRTKNTRVKRGLSARGRRRSFWPSKVQEGNVLQPMFCHYNGGLSGRCGPILQEQPLKSAVVIIFTCTLWYSGFCIFISPEKDAVLRRTATYKYKPQGCCPYSTGHVNHSEAFPIVRMSLSCSTLVVLNILGFLWLEMCMQRNIIRSSLYLLSLLFFLCLVLHVFK